MEDKPGKLAATVRTLGNAKVNIESIYVLGKKEGKTQVALEVDNANKAKEIMME